jgi:hypothetical protein
MFDPAARGRQHPMTGLPQLPSVVSNIATRKQALELVRAAFLIAKRKSGSDVRAMTLAVLKNRLLQITDRRFDPTDFGAKDLRAFVAMLSPDVLMVGKPSDLQVELVPQKKKREKAESHSTADPSAVAPAPAAELRRNGGRIREDLWLAIMDYASGQIYVWDANLGHARPAEPNDQQPVMPTLTPVELTEWRLTFFEANKGTLSGQSLANAQRWQAQGLGTGTLPVTLQQPWNRELSLRVRQRLQNFFANFEQGFGRDSTPSRASNPKSAEEIMESELAAARDRSDNFSVGELFAQQLSRASSKALDGLLAKATSAWGSTKGIAMDPDSLGDIVERIQSFSAPNLATAFVNALRRIERIDSELPESAKDLAYRLRADIGSIYGIEKGAPLEICRSALTKLDDMISEGVAAVGRFLRTTPATAKIASIEMLKVSHRLQPLLVPSERQFLRDLEILIGPAFRKLCEAYERNDDLEVIRRAPEYLENIKIHRPGATDPRLKSLIWLSLVQPVLDHLTSVVEDATTRGEVALAPALALRNPSTKADLRTVESEIYLSFSLVNHGKGHAHDVSLKGAMPGGDVILVLVEPSGPFDVSPNGEQLVRVRLLLTAPSESLDIPIEWTCQTTGGKQAVAADRLLVSQQVTEPDWDALLAAPPYSLNPIKRPERLYGRDSLLRKLRLAAMAGASTFVWGQKRIGKTSLLQVLAAELTERSDTTCTLLRMGELVSLHEGQIARLIAQRLVQKSGSRIAVPEESDFGAGLSRLIPFIEELAAADQGRKFIVIIDEFDDLDPAFYTGERGKQFIKALRSVSEVGLTFFFVGSERMEAIYSRHQADLNKWTNVRLDRIDSRKDCKALIVEPVSAVIEFAPEAIDFIIDYTAGNPFYIHNFCYQVFERCLQEHRTFVDENDTYAVRQQLLRALGPTNFSHLWEDNPVLNLQEKRREGAENCIALSCIASLGGSYEALEELQEAQESLQMAPEDRASGGDLRRACDRLVKRGVLIPRKNSTGFVLALQIFREWLGENALSKLLPVWTEHVANVRLSEESELEPLPIPEPTEGAPFPVPEDDMLAVAQRLMYCGRQKDVAEIRSWLRQFDDDGRIEIAFLLLQRIAERGFVNEGMKALAQQKLEEMINANRLNVGEKSWQIVRSRRDNLAIGYLDSEHKSGAVTARELQKSLRPGKCTPAVDLDSWMRTHIDADGIVVIVDDFAGTGQTISKGMKKFKDKIAPETWKRYIDENRISLYLMFAFPEALERARMDFPGVEVVAATVFGDELRACDDASDIFQDEGERRFAKEILQQIGRELSPGAPMGHGDMGALVIFHNTAPNNTLPVFWSSGQVGERPWKALFPRA